MKEMLFLVLVFFCEAASGQNLVLNGSFEDQNVCTELKAKCSPSAWFPVSNFCVGYPILKVPSVFGNKHVELLVADRDSSWRQYSQTILLCSIEVGKMYKISLKVAAPEVGPNLNDIGFYFTDSLIHTIYDTLLQPEKYMHFLDAKFKKLKSGWFELQKEFTATENKKVLIIGNFSIKSNRQIVEERRLSSKNVYIAVDDITITSTDKDNCSGNENLKDSLYSIKERHSNSKYIGSIINIKANAKQRIDTIIINNIEFDFKSYNIKNTHNLQTLNERLIDSGITKIQILGFTDTIGTKAYNKDLSLRRANAVAAYIRHTFDFVQPIEVEGRGVSSVYKNPEQNRRVEIYIFR